MHRVGRPGDHYANGGLHGKRDTLAFGGRFAHQRGGMRDHPLFYLQAQPHEKVAFDLCAGVGPLDQVNGKGRLAELFHRCGFRTGGVFCLWTVFNKK